MMGTASRLLVAILAISAPFAGSSSAQDARVIALIQERDAQAARVAERIAFEVAHAYNSGGGAVAEPAAPRELTAAERKQIHDALARVAACATGKLVKDAGSPLYLPEVDAKCRASPHVRFSFVYLEGRCAGRNNQKARTHQTKTPVQQSARPRCARCPWWKSDSS